jgi:His/Glu/Gln/Arg/opine family amino acid ABC transporter permease subunit
MLEFISRYWDSYLIGLVMACAISAAAMAASIMIGTVGAQARRSRYALVRWLASGYVAVFRAVPPLLTLYLVYFGLPTWAAQANVPVLSQFLEPLNNRIVAAIVAFALTSGAYSTEIIRSGIESVHSEQIDAAQSIGMTSSQTFRRVIAPQAFRVAFPPLGSEYIYVLKGTSLASVIGVVELMRTAQLAAGATFQSLLAYSLAGAYYLGFVLVLQLTLGRLEHRFPGAVKRA